MRHAAVLAGIGLLALSVEPAGAEPATSKAYQTCMKQSGGVTSAMLDCSGAETSRQDKALNAAYQALMPGLTPARQKQLREAQRLWIAFRDANCAFYEDPDGGTAANLAAADCFLQATAGRAAELLRLKSD